MKGGRMPIEGLNPRKSQAERLKFDRRLLLNFDWVLLSMVFAICGIALVNLYSAGSSLASLKGSPIYIKQTVWILMGIVFMGVFFSIDYRTIVRHAYEIYGVSILLLLVVFFLGEITRGTQRWISFGGFSLQPSELLKLTIILVLARFFNANGVNQSYTLRRLWVPIALVLVPFLLIMKQPDLGTAMMILIIFVSMTLFVGVNWKSIVLVVSTGILMTPLCWAVLKDYQKERILTFLDPDKDPLGSGYHIIQSIIAIGSGGIIGKGFMKGTQSQLRFLPEHQTDFVFSVFAEEWGFLGSSLLIFIFLCLVLWSLRIAKTSRDLLGTLIAFGIAMLIFWELFINLGMVLGIFPVVGIPLPFLSYGGSAIVVLMSSIGLLMNVSVRRFILQP
jgi:rod shape determining protein RodA